MPCAPSLISTPRSRPPPTGSLTRRLVDNILASVDPEIVKATKKMTVGTKETEKATFASLWGGKAHADAFNRALKR